MESRHGPSYDYILSLGTLKQKDKGHGIENVKTVCDEIRSFIVHVFSIKQQYVLRNL